MSNPFEAFFAASKKPAAANPTQPVIVVDDVEEVSQQSFGDSDLLGLGGAADDCSVQVNHKPQRPVILMKNFPWTRSTAERKEDIVDVFHSYFARKLRDDAAFSCFEPFTKYKYVERYADMGDIDLEAAPTLTHDQIKCKESCKLRDYQLTGVQFLLNNFHRGMSAILADDMGLGKTAQLCAFLGVLHSLHGINGPHLIVVPLSTITGWVRELSRWAPGLKVHKYQGSKGMRSLEGTKDSVIVTTPATLINDKDRLRGRAWVTMTVDEAHMLKNGNTQIVTLCSKMTACMRVSLTGTPIQNTVREVWSQMSYLIPFVFDKRGEIDDDAAVEQSSKVLSVIMLRRTKGSMDLGIPPKTEEPTLMIEPTELQNTMLAALGASSDNVDGATVGRLFMNLRKICNHPMTVALLADEQRERVVAGEHNSTGLARLHSANIPLTEDALVHPSAKMIKLELMLKELKEGGHRVLIFSNFTSQLDVLEGFCTLRGYHYERLDGSSNRVERELSIARFNQPECKTFIFLISTVAGGVGVTLTGADTVILYDCHYNPQIDRQAADRAHRIGQKRPVRIFKMCLKGTAEEQIQRIAQAKAVIGDMVVDGIATSSSGAKFFSIDDMRKLLKAAQAGAHSTTNENRFLPMLLEALDKDPSEGSVATKRTGGIRVFENRSNVCFNCDETMRPLEALVFCGTCPKGYHPDCLQEKGPYGRQWTCPRHFCRDCSKSAHEDGSLFYCVSCPASYCLDCLHPDYMALGDDGVELRDVSRTYPGMEAEGMAASRVAYYITCRSCAGLDTTDNDDDETESYN